MQASCGAVFGGFFLCFFFKWHTKVTKMTNWTFYKWIDASQWFYMWISSTFLCPHVHVTDLANASHFYTLFIGWKDCVSKPFLFWISFLFPHIYFLRKTSKWYPFTPDNNINFHSGYLVLKLLGGMSILFGLGYTMYLIKFDFSVCSEWVKYFFKLLIAFKS